MKQWALGGGLDAMPTETTLLRLWESTESATKYKYVQLSRMDQKRYTARRIEEILASKGLTIGVQGPNLDNVVISVFKRDKPITLVSTLLSHKIATFTIKNIEITTGCLLIAIIERLVVSFIINKFTFSITC